MIQELNATNSKTLFAEINGRKIAYRSIGNGDPIILCQRFRGNLDDWDPVFLDALSRNYNVITFDYTGFASSTGNPPTSMPSSCSGRTSPRHPGDGRRSLQPLGSSEMPVTVRFLHATGAKGPLAMRKKSSPSLNK